MRGCTLGVAAKGAFRIRVTSVSSYMAGGYQEVGQHFRWRT